MVPVLIVSAIPDLLTSTAIYFFIQASVLGHRAGLRWGKAEFAADIRALDGQRFLDLLPLTKSVGTEGPPVAESQPNVLHSVSSITCASELPSHA
jgi:hypothetical protein